MRLNEFVSLWRPNLSRTDDSETPGEWGASAEAGACSRLNLPRVGQSGAEVGIRVAAAGSGQNPGPTGGGGKLKT